MPVVPADDSVVPIQGQTVGTRTVIVNVLVNGVLTPVQMQAVMLSDSDGNQIDPTPDRLWQRAVLTEMRAIRRLLALFLGVYEPIQQDDSGGPEQNPF